MNEKYGEAIQMAHAIVQEKYENAGRVYNIVERDLNEFVFEIALGMGGIPMLMDYVRDEEVKNNTKEVA